jgi:hypothetical protein
MHRQGQENKWPWQIATVTEHVLGSLDIPMVQKGKFSAGADELVMALKKVDFLL